LLASGGIAAEQQISPLRYFDLLKNLIVAMTAMSRIKNSKKFDRLMSMCHLPVAVGDGHSGLF
jgi:hypothetical protein